MQKPTPHPATNNEALSCAAMVLLFILMLVVFAVGLLGMAK